MTAAISAADTAFESHRTLLFGVAFGLVHLKRTGALRRLFATPTSPSYFLSAQVLSRLIIGIAQVAILIGVGIWFGLQMFGDYGTLTVIVIIGSGKQLGSPSVNATTASGPVNIAL